MGIDMGKPKKKEHPGRDKYPDLAEPLTYWFNEDLVATVQYGQVTFTRWDGVLGRTVNVSMSEWDFGDFVEAHLIARMNQRYGEGNVE